MRRVESATAVPGARLSMPKTARQRRRRNQRRVRLPLTGLRRVVLSARWISLCLLGLCIYALYLIGMTEAFYLTLIPVEGTISIPPAEVVDNSGLAGVHIFAADPAQAAAQIAEVPGVISAAVTLNWPNQATIEIQEDSPIAIWREGREQFWVTKNGRLIPARSQSLGMLMIEVEAPAVAAASGSPGIEGAIEETAVLPGETETAVRDFVPQDILTGAMQLRELRPNIDILFYQPGSGLSYQDGRGWRVYFGAGADMHQKLVVYETIVDELLARGLTPVYVSVSNQEKPYFRAQ